jgi:hypothetical protein
LERDDADEVSAERSIIEEVNGTMAFKKTIGCMKRVEGGRKWAAQGSAGPITCKVPKTGTYEAMGDEMERNRIR